jgi:hypothetical protein
VKGLKSGAIKDPLPSNASAPKLSGPKDQRPPTGVSTREGQAICAKIQPRLTLSFPQCSIFTLRVAKRTISHVDVKGYFYLAISGRYITVGPVFSFSWVSDLS